MSTEIPTNAVTEADTPEEEMYMEQTQKWLSELVLVPVMTMEEFEASLPKPPPLSTSKKIKLKFLELRDIYYARKFAGMTGVLANGVTWRLSKPNPDIEGGTYFKDRGLCLDFDDPRSVGLLAGGSHFVDYDFEERYLDTLQEHARKMALRNLVPCEPSDPDGFYVRWGTSEDREQWKQRPGWR